jgi:hypothetical protein
LVVKRGRPSGRHCGTTHLPAAEWRIAAPAGCQGLFVSRHSPDLSRPGRKEKTSGGRRRMIEYIHATRSTTVTDEMNIDFAWLNSPDYSDNFVRVNERLNAAMRHHVETERPRELNRLADEVFAKYGIVDPDEPFADAELLNKLIWELSHRFALHVWQSAEFCGKKQ